MYFKVHYKYDYAKYNHFAVWATKHDELSLYLTTKVTVVGCSRLHSKHVTELLQIT